MRLLVSFLGAIRVLAAAHPSFGAAPAEGPVELGYRALADTSPVPRGLFGRPELTSAKLAKRQCNPGDLYCAAVNLCCVAGNSCCGYNFCCAPGYVCPVSGPCVKGDVVTVTYTSTYFTTLFGLSTVYTTSTSWVGATSTSYTTSTTHVQGGVSTSTVWTTLTTTQVVAKRAPLTMPTAIATDAPDVQEAAPMPTSEPFFIEGQTPATELLRRALADIGILKARAVTSYVTVLYTSTVHSNSITTVRNVITSTSNGVVTSTITSSIVDNASSTTTVTSTSTSTVTSHSDGPTPAPPSASGTSSGGLTTSNIIEIVVPITVAVISGIFGYATKKLGMW